MYKIFLIILCLPKLCFAATSLWEVSKNDLNLYLGGTIHLLKQEDYPLPNEYGKAFSKADVLVFETDIDASKSAEFAKKMSQMLTYPQGQSLADILNQATLSKLERHLTSRTLALNNFTHLKPAMVVLALSIIEMQRMGMTAIGVDEHFHIKAKSAGKRIAFLESINSQLNFIAAMGAGKENEFISKTIDDIDRMESTIEEMKNSWLTGDETRLAKVTIQDMMRDYPELYKSLLVDRNNNWLPLIEELMLDKDVELVLVGALHLVGEDGLLQQLRNKGYTVKPFK